MKLKVITLNVWMGGILFDEILTFLKKESPDILLMQEVFRNENPSDTKNGLLDTLKKEANLPYFAFAPSFKDVIDSTTYQIRGNAISSKFPILSSDCLYYGDTYKEIIDHENHPETYSTVPRNLQFVKIDVNGHMIQLYNTQGIWGLDGGDSEPRLKMSDFIVNQIKNKTSVILGGDFNVKPHTKTIDQIEEHLTNIFQDELTSTFNMKHKTNPGYASAVVDMLFVSKDIKIVEHSCPQIDVSDHLPLVSILELN